MNVRVILSVVLLAAAIVTTLFLVREESTPGPSPTEPTAQQSQPSARPDSTGIETAEVTSAPDPIDDVPPQELVRMPDGTKVRALNGATGLKTLGWPKDIPYAPVVEKVWHVKSWWYRHADGSYSTFFVDRDGKSWAHVANPLTPSDQEPIEGPDGPRLPGSSDG